MMSRQARALALPLAILFLASPTHASVYREQAEQTDWLLPTIGAVHLAAYAPTVAALPPGAPPPPPVGWSPSSFGAPTSLGGGPALFVGSAVTLAVAGLDVGSGEVVWRQFLPAPPLALAAVPTTGAVITLSASNASSSLTLHAWRGADGAKLWERRDPLPAACSDPAAAALAATASTVLLACDGLALGLDVDTGATYWRVPLGGAPAAAGGEGGAALTAVASDDGETFALAWAGAGSAPSTLGTALLSSFDGSLTAVDSVRPTGGGGRLAGRAVLARTAGGFVAAALSGDGRRVCAAPVGGGGAQCAPVPSAAGACTTLTPPLPGVGGGAPAAAAAAVVALACEHGSLGGALDASSGGGVAISFTTPLSAGATAAATTEGGVLAAAAVDAESGNVIVTTTAGTGGSSVSSSHALKWAAPGCTAPSTPPVAAWALPPLHPPTADPDAAGALFVVASDGASALVRLARAAGGAPGGRRAIGLTHWARPGDAVAGAVAALHAPLPPPSATAAAAAAASLPPLSARLRAALRTEWLAAKAMAGAASPAEAGELRAARAAAGGRGAPTADRHGFRQAALALGPGGTLTALHAGDGHILWRLPGLVPAGEAGSKPAAARLLLWRSGDGRGAAPTVLALWRGGWAEVDAWAGSVVTRGATPFPVGQVVELPGAIRGGGGGSGGKARGAQGGAASEQRVVLLVERTPPPPSPLSSSSDDSPRWALLPPTPAAAALAAAAGPLRWWRADAGAGTLTGYVAEGGGGGGGGGGTGGGGATAGTASVAWRHAFGPGAILAVAAPPASATPSATAAVVTGSRALKLKPDPAGWAFVVTADAGGRGVTASFFDGASGQAIFRQTHAGGAGPALATWLGDGGGVAYTFSGPPPAWSVGGVGGAAPGAAPAPILPPTARLPPRPWHLATIDIYDARRAAGVSAGSLALNALGLGAPKGKASGGDSGAGAAAAAPQSAWDPFPIDVHRATFSLPVHPVSLTPTVTARGVAPTVLLVGTSGGELLALPRRVVDPRRPPPGDAAAVAAGAAEGLPPYHPTLPAPPTAYATHGSRLGSIGGGSSSESPPPPPPVVAVAPAVLESTALVFGAGRGGDAWGSRLQPSSSFDLPPPDFPYGLLAAVTGATGVGAALLKAAAGRAALRAKWE